MLHWIFPYQYLETTLLESLIDGQEGEHVGSESGGTNVEAVLVSDTKGASEKGVNEA